MRSCSFNLISEANPNSTTSRLVVAPVPASHP